MRFVVLALPKVHFVKRVARYPQRMCIPPSAATIFQGPCECEQSTFLSSTYRYEPCVDTINTSVTLGHTLRTQCLCRSARRGWAEIRPVSRTLCPPNFAAFAISA